MTALRDQTSAPNTAPQAAWWAEAIRDCLKLMLPGRDKSAAALVRTLTHLYPFADEMRRLRRAQALFAAIRPARSLAAALESAS
jgi:hypothetical protein